MFLAQTLQNKPKISSFLRHQFSFLCIAVPFQEVPKYNDKRRPTLAGTIGLHRSRSDPRLNVAGVSGAGLFLRSNSSSGSGSKPPSPALSNNSLPQYVSNGNLFESSGAGMLYRGHHYDSDSPRSMSISDTGSCSGLSGERRRRRRADCAVPCVVGVGSGVCFQQPKCGINLLLRCPNGCSIDVTIARISL